MERFIASEKIIELGSFTKAASALGHTQSAVSQMIASLESERDKGLKDGGHHAL